MFVTSVYLGFLGRGYEERLFAYVPYDPIATCLMILEAFLLIYLTQTLAIPVCLIISALLFFIAKNNPDGVDLFAALALIMQSYRVFDIIGFILFLARNPDAQNLTEENKTDDNNILAPTDTGMSKNQTDDCGISDTDDTEHSISPSKDGSAEKTIAILLLFSIIPVFILACFIGGYLWTFFVFVGVVPYAIIVSALAYIIYNCKK